MTYAQWCFDHIKPIVDQFNDGVITLDEMTSAIYQAVCFKGGFGPFEKQED